MSATYNPIEGITPTPKYLGEECQRCHQEPATHDYNGHGCYVCEHCNNVLNNEFDEEYD